MNAEAEPAAPVPTFKKRGKNANLRKRPATLPPASDSEEYSSEDDSGQRVKRRRKLGPATVSSKAKSAGTQDISHDTQYAADRSKVIEFVNDATKQSNWYDEGKEDDLSAKNLLGKTRAKPQPDSNEAVELDGTYKGNAAYGNFIRKNKDADYMKRVLTFDHDHFNAIQGVLNGFAWSPIQPLHHYWGLPISKIQPWNLGDALYWQAIWPIRSRRGGFPTWSWLGYRFHAETHRVWFAHLHFLNDPEKLHIRPGGAHLPDPGASVCFDALDLQDRSPILTLDTYVGYVKIRSDSSGGYKSKCVSESGPSHGLRIWVATGWTVYTTSTLVHEPIELAIDLDVDSWSTFAGDVRDGRVVCAFVAEFHNFFGFLLLIEEDDGFFARIGLARYGQPRLQSDEPWRREREQKREKVSAMHRKTLKLK